MKFLIHGSIAYDLLLSHEGSFVDAIDPKTLDRLSINYLAQGFVRHHGGTAANISWNLALLGEQPMAIGAVGTDGAEYLTLLKDRGIDLRYVSQSRTAITATAIIATDSGERQISFFHPGADGEAALPDFSDERDTVALSIISPRNPMLMLEAARRSTALKIPYLFDPGQVVHAFRQDDFRTALQGSRGLIVNEYEWSLASVTLGWDESEVVSQCGMLVRTLGDKGLVILTKKEAVEIPACPPSRLINPTGAGDAARAGLLFGCARQWPLVQSGRLAAILGSLVCEQEGTLLDSLDMDLVKQKAKQTYGEALPRLQ